MINETILSAGAAVRDTAVARRTVEIARRMASGMLRVTDSALHSARRNRARAQLPATVAEVLVICYGNICRSPYAAAILAHELGAGGPTIRSAGFYGPDRSSPDAALTVARQRGMNLDAHRSMLVTADMVTSADLIVVMERCHVRQVRSQFGTDRRRIVLLGDFDPDPIETRALVDPYGGDTSVFEASYERIERCVRELAAAIRRHASS